MAGAPAAVPNTVLQVKVSRLSDSFILPVLRQYATHYGAGLQNCANLSLVYLGFIKDSKKYLQTCTGRGIRSDLSEISDVIRAALAKTGVYLPPFVEGVNPLPGPVDAENTFASRLRYLGESLLPNHATIVGIQFADGSRHAAILRKEEDSSLTFVDYQIIMPDGSYPAAVVVPEGNIAESPYQVPITSVLAFLGPVVSSPRNLILAKFEATGKEGFYMNTLGGRRRSKKTLKKKSKTKRKSR